MPYLDPGAGKRRETTGAAAVTVANLTATAGTPDSALADVGASFNQATLNDNFRDVQAKVNAILAELRKAGIVA